MEELIREYLTNQGVTYFTKEQIEDITSGLRRVLYQYDTYVPMGKDQPVANCWKLKAYLATGKPVAYVHSMPGEFRLARYGNKMSSDKDVNRSKLYTNEGTAQRVKTMLIKAGWTKAEIIPMFESVVPV